MILSKSEERPENSISATYNAFEDENGGEEIIDRVIIEAYFDSSELQGQHQTSLSGQTVGEALFHLFGYPRTGVKLTTFCKRWFGWIFLSSVICYVLNVVLSWFFPWSLAVDAIVFAVLCLIVSLTGIMLLQYEFLKLLCWEITWYLQIVDLWLSVSAYFYAKKKYWDSGLIWVAFCGLPLVVLGSSFDAVGLDTIPPKTRCLVWLATFIVSLFFLIREGSKYAKWDVDLEKQILFYGKMNMHDLGLNGLSGSVIFSGRALWAAISKPGEFHLITASVRRKKDVINIKDEMLGCFNSCRKKIVRSSIEFLE